MTEFLFSAETPLWLALILARSLVLAALAGGVLLLLRRSSAAVRHLALALTLGGLLLLPPLYGLLPAWSVPLPARPAVPSAPAPVPAASEGVAFPQTQAPAPSSVLPPAAPPSSAASPAPSPVSEIPPAHVAAPPVVWPLAVAPLWCLGLVLSLVPLVAGLIRLRRAAGRYPTVSEGPLSETVAALAREMGVRRPVRLLLGDATEPGVAPMTWGLLRPVLLLPADAAQWPTERLRAVLLHELAHIRRGDWAVQTLARVVCALYWPNPLAWLLARRLQAESEHACDDRVLLCGVEPPDYAAQLLEAVRATRASRALSAAVPMARHRSPVESRLRAILDRKRDRRGAARITVVTALLVVAGLLALLAALRLSGERSAKEAAAAERHPLIVSARGGTAALPNGVQVELVGIAYAEAGRSGSWRPDGAPLTRPMPAGGLAFSGLTPDLKGRACAVQVAYGPEARGGSDPEDLPNYTWRFSPEPVSSSSFGKKPGLDRTYEETRAAGDKTTEFFVFPQAFNGSTAATDLEFGVAAGPWRTVASAAAMPERSVSTASGDASFLLTLNSGLIADWDGRPVKGDAYLRVWDDLADTANQPYQVDRRIVAVTKQGRTIPLWEGSRRKRPLSPGASIRNAQVRHFPKALLKDIREFRLQIRPYQWASFKNVVLQPGVTNLPAPGGVTVASGGKGRVPGGPEVELAGVSGRERNGTWNWWHYDGAPAPSLDALLPGTFTADAMKTKPDERLYRFTARLAGRPGADVTTTWRFDAMSHRTYSESKGDGIYTAMLEVPAPANRAKATVTLGIAEGEWTTVAVSPPPGENGARVGPDLEPAYAEKAENMSMVGLPGSTVLVRLPSGLENYNYQFVAVDRKGTLHRSGSNGGSGATAMTNFSDVPRGQVREIRLQARPYRWLEFRDVPLRPGAAAPAAVRPASALPTRSNVVVAANGKATLPDGATVELVGVADASAGDKGAWRPDGSPLGRLSPLGSTPLPEPPATGSGQVRYLRYRCTFPGAETATTRWEFSDGGRGGDGGMYQDLQQKSPSTLKADTALVMERPQRQVTARLGLASGPFRSILRASLPGASEHTLSSGERATVEARFPPETVLPRQGATACILLHAPARINRNDYRLVARDTRGKQHFPASGTVLPGNENEKEHIYAFSFTTVEQNDIREVVLQTRPFHWVEFRNVALEPRG